MSNRVYVGKLPYDVRERDLEDLFKSCGRVRDVVMKNGFGFVEFDDPRDADDAVYDKNGAKLLGERIVVEHCHRRNDGPSRGYGGYGGGYGGYGGGGGYRNNPSSRYGPPVQTSHRLIVENLSSRVSWQDLKDFFRGKNCEVTYADAHKRHKNEALICFASRRDLKRALDYEGYEMNGRRIKLINDSRTSRSRSRSRSRSPSRRRGSRSSGSRSKSRSRSLSGSKSPSRSGSNKTSRSPSPSTQESNNKNSGGDD